MESQEQAFEEAVLRRVCDSCMEQRDDGSCGLDPDLECAIRKHLPRIIEAVDGTKSDQVAEYVGPIRTGVCAVCEEDRDGTCEVRERVDCPLDRYLSLVIDAIEDVRREREEPTSR